MGRVADHAGVATNIQAMVAKMADFTFSIPPCPGCRKTFKLHQPDPDWPDRLLGVCTHCRTWAIIDVGDVGGVILTELPGPQAGTR